MTTKVVTIRLPPKDTQLIDFFIKEGEFKSRSDFLRYAAKRMIAELISKKLDAMVVTKKVDEKELDRVHKLIKETRQELWREKYAEGVP